MLKIIKIGGGIIDDEVSLKQFLLNFSQVEGPKYWFMEVEEEPMNN